MSTNERLQKLLVADQRKLARIDMILDGTDTAPVHADRDNRLVTFTDAARRLNVSRPTVYRLARAGRLEVVPLNGVSRISVKSINALVG